MSLSSRSGCLIEMAKGTWRIDLFGGLKLQHGERVLTRFETRRIDALLACLALRLHRAHPREILAEQLWPEEDWDATRNRMRQALSSLRHTLEPEGAPEGSVLITDRSEVSLDPAVVTTDVEEFEAALDAADRTENPGERSRLLRQAVDLYTGELLPGFYEEWVIAERGRLGEVYRTALGRLADSLEGTGDFTGAIDMARRCVAEDPLREDAHCALMRLYAVSGRTSEALRQFHDLERRLREELSAAPSVSTRALLEELRADLSSSPALLPPAEALVPPPASSVLHLEAEGGAVPLDSPFYIARPTDEQFSAALARRDSIVLVKGPRQTGKTSLLARGLQQARATGANVVLTDLQKLAPEQLESAASLFRAFAEMISDQLEMDVALDDHWNPRRGWNVNFERFLRREVLSGPEAEPGVSLIWGLDEVDRLFNRPFSNVVFGLFRSWHNERSLNPAGSWGRLTLAIAYATEAHLFITDLNQSPFNVGTRLTLEDFTLHQVGELNRRYGSPLSSSAELERYFRLVGGHPYLSRRGLHALAEKGLDVAALEAPPEREDAIFGDHLRRMLAALTQDAELCEAVRAVLQGKPCPSVEAFYRLRSAGVLVGESVSDARPRCGLYRSYLKRQLVYKGAR